MLLSLALGLTMITVVAADKLQTVDAVLGKGSEAAKGDVVTLSYTGWLQDGGKEFDSSKGQAPIAFVLGQGMVIKGWDDGIEKMKTGGRRILVIPASMGYGDKGTGDIPGKATLVFDVTLLRVDKKGVLGKIETVDTVPGTGDPVGKGDLVKLHYTGSFLGGAKFDSSLDRNKPFDVEAGAGKVIPGFDEGILGMKKGGKRKVTIPYTLGYGERGAGGVIPPYATLVFELEVLEITKK